MWEFEKHHLAAVKYYARDQWYLQFFTTYSETFKQYYTSLQNANEFSFIKGEIEMNRPLALTTGAATWNGMVIVSTHAQIVKGHQPFLVHVSHLCELEGILQLLPIREKNCQL